ncbi:MAG TPA: glycosyltransferase 87 family protein, partial [Chloroflexota bacterium]
LVFALMPQVVTGAIYGNVHGPVFAALALCLVLVDRHPVLAGFVASVGWLKPQLALPLILLIFLFQTRSRRAFATGFGLATLVLLGLTAMTTGLHSVVLWIQGLNSWSQGIAREPNISSLSGLYAAWASRGLQLFFAAALLIAALGLTAVVWRKMGGRSSLPLICTGWLWAVWFLASPFTHFPDEVVLTIPFLALFGRNAARLSTRFASSALYLAFFSLILFSSPLVSVSVVAFAVILYRVRSAQIGESSVAASSNGAA